MTILITGAAGFVANHFIAYLQDLQLPCTVIGLYHNTIPTQVSTDKVKLEFVHCNLLDADKVLTILQQYQPNFVVHLAAQSSVANSWLHPAETVANNVSYFVNICEAVRKIKMDCRILSVGSAEVYGADEQKALTENRICTPNNPYGIGRLAQENMMHLFVKTYNLDIVGTRSFNHIGPGQDTRFVIPSFAKQIMEQKNAGEKVIDLQVGNIEIIRDFLDVRDVVQAYYLLMEQGEKGEIYNVCSGKGTSIADIIAVMAGVNNIEVKTIAMPERIRPNDIVSVVGDNSLLKSATGWVQSISMEKTVSDIVKHMGLNT
jgi:GDP-4-dehydro-6-deoxy-D-mannose reductase